MVASLPFLDKSFLNRQSDSPASVPLHQANRGRDPDLDPLRDQEDRERQDLASQSEALARRFGDGEDHRSGGTGDPSDEFQLLVRMEAQVWAFYLLGFRQLGGADLD
ncbi:hypothetical protein CMV_022252 [Castanea mollissima]|uniref:Uncharacterized protein n=1 Tax=Castanea mollissima TaxID=60419 RepID=A0A8J4VBT2_9ROSI|nr:hypothetical protein CMV_022252 [Castanea mollissima]